MKSIHICLYLSFLLLILQKNLEAQNYYDNPIPFSTNEEQLTIWNGNEYIPFFIKGVNLGVSVPGTLPGELAASSDQYEKWFTDIKNAGFNCIRLYTLHFPRFFEELASYNQANPQNPLFFFQGIWLNESITDYANDLYFLTDTFQTEITENVDCVHGNGNISSRYGKAYGSYTVDASNWCLGYIIGREIYPEEILTTNSQHSGITSYTGNHLSISDVQASEAWYIQNMDYLIEYENSTYKTERPISFSSWPTLDPLSHETDYNDEDIASVDLSGTQLTNAPAGLFISYHAYPYYPDFISDQTSYQTYYDNLGPNSYIGYLTELKSHYPKFPLIIAEYGVPSSWGIAHYTTSGMNHGGFDEKEQGETDIRLLHSIEEAQCGGGIQFAWIDEWFKRTWITDPIDYNIERRARWHNIAAAEQNFGLLGFQKETNYQLIKEFGGDSAITYIKEDADYAFFKMEIGLNNPLDIPDNLWITLDTYSDSLGESILSTGDTIPYRSEFALSLTNYTAELYVMESYDLFGIWHNILTSNQLNQSTVSDGNPWYIVRWKNNSGHSDVQYIGSMKVNYDFQSPSTKDAVTISDDKIQIQIPWSLLNVVDPSQMRVFHDDRTTEATEDTVSNGFNIAVLYKDQWFKAGKRFSWEKWSTVANADEYYKTSYYEMQDRLHEFNTPAIAVIDSFAFSSSELMVDATEGLLMNDFDLDGDSLYTLITENPQNGQIDLYDDGSFWYIPNSGFKGTDSIKYCIFDGYSLSTPNSVIFSVQNSSSVQQQLASSPSSVHLFPIPCNTILYVETTSLADEILIFDSLGKKVAQQKPYSTKVQIDVSHLNSGVYFVLTKIDNNVVSKKITIVS